MKTNDIDKIMAQLNGKTFHSVEQVNDFFREKLYEVEQRKVEEIIKTIQSKQNKISDGTEFNAGVEAGYRYLIKELSTNKE